MATIDDVARRAGVHRTTVSHALSGNRPVATATRERILAIVRELGYQPNAAARSLVLRHTRTIGLVAPMDTYVTRMSAANYGEFVMGVADRLAARDYRLLCLVARDRAASDAVSLAQSGQVDGMLLLQVRTADPRVGALQATNLPFVTIGRARKVQGVVWADADFVAAGRLAVRHLAELGHRRIAFLCSWHDGAPTLGFEYHALLGFWRAHRELHLPLRRAQILSQGADQTLRQALDPLLAPDSDITALITTTSEQAALGLPILTTHRRRVPDDISLMSLFDPQALVPTPPPITAVTFSPADLTHLAVDLLLDMLQKQPPSDGEHLVPVHLLARSSTRRVGPPVETAAPPCELPIVHDR